MESSSKSGRWSRTPPPPDLLAANPHLSEYLHRWALQGNPNPVFIPVLTEATKSTRPLNLLYPVGDPVFIHIEQATDGLFPKYHPIEPEIPPEQAEAYQALRGQVFLRAPDVAVPDTWQEALDSLKILFDQSLDRGLSVGTGWRRRRIALLPELVERLRYRISRDVVGYGPLEPLARDPWIEDVHGTGRTRVHVVHKLFGMVETDIQMSEGGVLDAYLETLGERMGRQISSTHPIVDGALPNGNRINVVYGEEVSKGGSSFTIRKPAEKPISVPQLVAWGTMDPRLAAYLWLCVENGMNVFVSGETASGKTTTLNAILAFINPKNKILTAEDTPEVNLPHENWQQLVTRDRGTVESRVTMHELLRAALRSRPNYIIVGEIRGAEGMVAFQAMQSGHSTLATFHASSVSKLVQRFSSEPINIPQPFMGNLNVVLIQSAVYLRGRILRRVLAVEEIEGFSKRANAVITRQVFGWDPNQDRHLFAGRNNSYVLENLVAPRLRLSDPREIYKELDRRAERIESLVKEKEFDYSRVARLFFEGQNGAARPDAATVEAVAFR